MANISDLQTFLFETLQDIKKGSVDVDKAKAINSLAQTMVNSAKAEIDFASVIGNVDSKFFSRVSASTALETPNKNQLNAEIGTATSESGKRTLQNGAKLETIGNKTVHRL